MECYRYCGLCAGSADLEHDVTILESLKEGPKLYSELRGQTDAALFDILLGKLLREKAVVLVYDFSGETARFGLPQPPKEDEPLPPSRELLHLRKPRKNQYDFDKGGRKRCVACGERRARSRFMYNGRVYARCFKCREEP